MSRSEAVAADGPRWLKRARPLLGTLVEVGVLGEGASTVNADEAAGTLAFAAACADAPAAALGAAFAAVFKAAFAAIADVQACLSRFEPGSDVARFNALPAGQCLPVRPHTAAVLAAAQSLHRASEGVFDITLGTDPEGWRCTEGRWHKLRAGVQVDLGGIGKGYAVDCAVRALQALGCGAGWVNAGGDLRAFGAVALPVWLRDEARGVIEPFASLSDGAFATSRFGAQSRSQAATRRCPQAMHVHAHASVAAPLCLWADALTKVVAITGDTGHPLLSRHGAQAWLH